MQPLLDALRFVQGAVSRKKILPTLGHFRIADGYVTGFDGQMALSSPIPCDLDATPNAEAFVAAIRTCEQEVSLHLTSNNRLAIRSGKFRAFINCTTDPYPDIEPRGEFFEYRSLLPAMKSLEKFVSTDASRPWSRGILFRGDSAYATNNVLLAQFWLHAKFPCAVNIPHSTVLEFLRIGEEPLGMQVCEESITFFYEHKRYLHSALYSNEWPDVNKILDSASAVSMFSLEKELFKTVEGLSPFVNAHQQVYFTQQALSTEPDPAAENGATFVYELPCEYACFALEQFMLLEGSATHLNFAAADRSNPRPLLWMGDNMRGVIIGMRA